MVLGEKVGIDIAALGILTDVMEAFFPGAISKMAPVRKKMIFIIGTALIVLGLTIVFLSPADKSATSITTTGPGSPAVMNGGTIITITAQQAENERRLGIARKLIAQYRKEHAGVQEDKKALEDWVNAQIKSSGEDWYISNVRGISDVSNLASAEEIEKRRKLIQKLTAEYNAAHPGETDEGAMKAWVNNQILLQGMTWNVDDYTDPRPRITGAVVLGDHSTVENNTMEGFDKGIVTGVIATGKGTTVKGNSVKAPKK